MKKVILSGAAAIVMGLGATSQAANLLTNAGFQTPDASAGDVANAPGAPWAGFNQGSLRLTTASQSNLTPQSIKTFGPFDGIGGGVGATQTVAATAGLNYTSSIYAKQLTGDALAGNNFGVVQLSFLNASSTQIGTTLGSTPFNAASAKDAWIQLSVSGVAPAGTAFARIGFVQVQLGDGNGGITGGAIYWDDASLDAVAVPEPTSIAALGASSLLLRRRRRA